LAQNAQEVHSNSFVFGSYGPKMESKNADEFKKINPIRFVTNKPKM
jgi:hypothetical protein